MTDYYRRLFAYDDWANRTLLAALQTAEAPPARAVRLLAHIFGAEWLWLERLQGAPRRVAVWPGWTLAECGDQPAPLLAAWTAYLQDLGEDGLDATIRYETSTGLAKQSRVGDVLTHVVLHAGYHRGQAAADLRATGIDPPWTDFIHATREELL